MEINGQITADEISKSFKNLKIEKTCCHDNIINEYIKSSAYFLFMLNCSIVYQYRVHGYQEILYPYSKTRENLVILNIID